MSTEYRIIQLDDKTFKIAKFSDNAGDQPENVYFVVWDKKKDEMSCNCPNRRRGKHVDDKHGKMCKSWLALGSPIGFFDQEGEFHGQPHLADNPAEFNSAAFPDAASEPEHGDLADLDGEAGFDPDHGDPFGDPEEEHR